MMLEGTANKTTHNKNMNESEQNKTKTADELAKWQAGWKQSNDHYILADVEWKRRNLEEQHNLNLELLKNQHELNLQILEKQSDLSRELHKKQSKLLKFSICATLMAAIIGTGFGFYLEHNWSEKKPKVPQKINLKQDVLKKSAHHKGIHEPLRSKE